MKMTINSNEIIGFINLSSKGDIKKILKQIKINDKKRNIKILVEPNIEDINLFLDKTLLIFSNELSIIRKYCDKAIIIKDNKIFKDNSIEQLKKYNYPSITIVANDVKNMKLPLKYMIIKSITDKKIKFLYKGDINYLIKILSNYEIDNIFIEKIKVEDIFNSCVEN